MFYGHAIGKGYVRFSGSFIQPDVYVNATINDSTQLIIPVSNEREATELKFIRFVEKHKKKKDEVSPVDQAELKGMSLEMDLGIREEAEMQLVFNEQAGDIIKGNGNGDIRILFPRGGEFQMYGDYIIEQGDYLFTMYQVVNKDFRIIRGGQVRWTGDPYLAEINLVAEYKGLTAPVANLIQEYLVNLTGDDENSRNARNNAYKPTDIDLKMKLEGPLLEPIINFDLDFPNLTGTLKSYADSKLRTVKQDQNELNRQVFGLIVIGQFLPDELSFAQQGNAIIYNTVGEFVSNQLSLLLTELFSEFIEDGSVLSGIDLDIAYSQYQAGTLGDAQSLATGQELQVTLKQDFLNDRLSVQLGGNFGLGNEISAAPEASGAFVGNDVVIEYVLNKDRTLKLRLYQRLEPDIGGGHRLQVGTGLSFRKEFDSFSEFLRSFRKTAKKTKKTEQPNTTD